MFKLMRALKIGLLAIAGFAPLSALSQTMKATSPLFKSNAVTAMNTPAAKSILTPQAKPDVKPEVAKAKTSLNTYKLTKADRDWLAFLKIETPKHKEIRLAKKHAIELARAQKKTFEKTATVQPLTALNGTQIKTKAASTISAGKLMPNPVAASAVTASIGKPASKLVERKPEKISRLVSKAREANKKLASTQDIHTPSVLNPVPMPVMSVIKPFGHLEAKKVYNTITGKNEIQPDFVYTTNDNGYQILQPKTVQKLVYHYERGHYETTIEGSKKVRHFVADTIMEVPNGNVENFPNPYYNITTFSNFDANRININDSHRDSASYALFNSDNKIVYYPHQQAKQTVIPATGRSPRSQAEESMAGKLKAKAEAMKQEVKQNSNDIALVPRGSSFTQGGFKVSQSNASYTIDGKTAYVNSFAARPL